MKISSIFSDYDGTLAPEDVELQASSLPEEIEGPLLSLSASVPVAIVTSKDIGFVRPRTPFARAWACVSGLEIVISDGMASTAAVKGDRLREGLRYLKRHDKFGLQVEPKRSSTNTLLGFSVDWRRTSPPPPEFIETFSSELARMGLTAVYDPTRPFLDVFGAKPDKGRAVQELRRLLSVDGNLLFLGDSVADKAAFEEADVGVCVAHGQSLEGLGCRYALRYEELGGFLRSLADNHLSFDPRTLMRKIS